MSKSPPPQQQPQPQQSPSTTTVVVLAASAVAAGVLLYSAYQFFDSSKPPRKLKPPKKINSQALALYSKRTAVAAAPVSAAATMVIRAPSRWIPKMYYTEAELTILLIGHSAASYAEASAKPSVTASTANAVSPVPVVRPAATASAPIAPLPEDVRAVLLPALWRIVIGYTAREECERPANPDIEVMYEHLGEVDLEHSVCDRSDLKGVLSCNMRYCDRCVIRGCAFCTEVKKRGYCSVKCQFKPGVCCLCQKQHCLACTVLDHEVEARINRGYEIRDNQLYCIPSCSAAAAAASADDAPPPLID